MHLSDVTEIAGQLDPLLKHKNFKLFSGASAGVHEGVLPRSTVARQLDDFLRYWAAGDSDSAKNILTQPDWWIDRIRVWSDRIQHDYINLMAPIDLLAIAFASAEIEKESYAKLRDQLHTRLAQKQAEFGFRYVFG